MTTASIADQDQLVPAFEALADKVGLDESWGEHDMLSFERTLDAVTHCYVEMGGGEDPGVVSVGIVAHRYDAETAVVSKEWLSLKRLLPAGLVEVCYVPPRPTLRSWEEVTDTALTFDSEDDEELEMIWPLQEVDPIEEALDFIATRKLNNAKSATTMNLVYGELQHEVAVDTLNALSKSALTTVSL